MPLSCIRKRSLGCGEKQSDPEAFFFVEVVVPLGKIQA